ncbi:MAG: PepSY domain-containing protein [Planctomycetes bacterium]|nr:PepSY domain-containing protein [Planctomycetota bacterium]
MSGKKVGMAVMAAVLVLTSGLFAEEMTRSEAKAPVSRQRAMQIAQQHVNGGRVVDSEFNNRWFRDNDYEFTVVDDQNRYEIQVDAENGQIISVDQTPIFRDNLSANDAQRVASAISLQRVREIAQERAPNALIVDMDRDVDSDRVVYNVEMMANNAEVDMQIDGMTGRILSYDENRDTNNSRLGMRRMNRRNLRETNARLDQFGAVDPTPVAPMRNRTGVDRSLRAEEAMNRANDMMVDPYAGSVTNNRR